MAAGEEEKKKRLDTAPTAARPARRNGAVDSNVGNARPPALTNPLRYPDNPHLRPPGPRDPHRDDRVTTRAKCSRTIYSVDPVSQAPGHHTKTTPARTAATSSATPSKVRPRRVQGLNPKFQPKGVGGVRLPPPSPHGGRAPQAPSARFLRRPPYERVSRRFCPLSRGTRRGRESGLKRSKAAVVLFREPEGGEGETARAERAKEGGSAAARVLGCRAIRFVPSPNLIRLTRSAGVEPAHGPACYAEIGRRPSATSCSCMIEDAK